MLKEYVCKNSECKKITEHIQKWDDPNLLICPHCGEKTLEPVEFSKGSFILSGTGWFKSGGY